MRKIFIIAVITLIALGCSKKDDETASKLPENKSTNRQEAGATQELQKTSEVKTGESPQTNNVEPVFKDYEYPTSILESTFSMGNTVSVIYKSADNFTKVVEFYNQKFPDAPPQSGTTVYFGKEIADGSGFTVTLTQLNNNTRIILKLDKKR